MFTIAHVSDIHADYRSGRIINHQGINVREADGYIALATMIHDIIEHHPDAVLIAGDVFHTPTPSVRAVTYVQGQLRKLWKARIPCYILAGNHDKSDIASDIAASRILNDPWRKIYSHAEPYAAQEIADGIYLHMISHHVFSEQGKTMHMVKPVKDAINILSTHGSVIDPIMKIKLHTNQSPREIVIPDALLDDFAWNYVMLGHIHERGWVGSTDKKTDTANTKIFYNGSLIRRGFADGTNVLGRGWTEWTIDDNGHFTPTLHQIPQRPQFEFPIIDADKISASDITDLIVQNLKDTQVDGITRNLNIAPILRQKIRNITPAKRASLDMKQIELNAGHALSWNIDSDVISTPANKSSDQLIEAADTSDMVKIYDDWTSSSQLVENTSKEIRESVVQQGRDFMKMGQEAILDEEN